MNEFLKKKSKASFMYAGIAILTLITTIIYIVFSSTYGIRNLVVALSLFGAMLLSVVLFLQDMILDSYLEVCVSILIGLGLVLFAVSCVGDYADAISQVVMFGSGAPIGGIIALDVMMFIDLFAAFISAGFKKGGE